MSIRIKVPNVQLHFPNIFSKRGAFSGSIPAKYAGVFSFPKESEQIKVLLDEVFSRVLSDKDSEGFEYFIKDGDYSRDTMFIGKWYMQASSLTAPVLIDTKGEVIINQIDLLYAEHYVDVVLDIWCTGDNYAKRVCATLVAVQLKENQEKLV